VQSLLSFQNFLSIVYSKLIELKLQTLSWREEADLSHILTPIQKCLSAQILHVV